MKKYVVISSIIFGLLSNVSYADALKNSLTSMLNEKETPSMVDLSRLGVDAKPKPKPIRKKTRSKKAVVAVVDGRNIRKRAADAHLKMRTKGKVSNFDLLPRKQRLRLIKEMALPIVVLIKAKKELTQEEKEAISSRTWMQKEAQKAKVDNAEIQKVYDQIKQTAIDNNSTRNILPFEQVKDRIKMQMIEKKIIAELMKDSEIRVW
ncbi:MAG: hypothetical protein U9O24_08660 [Campylobacterota bacterium]|nr:hypothetical protein [Campylobacterota bacterium]